MFLPEKFLISRFSATDEKQVLNAFAMVSELLDILSFIFIGDTLLIISSLLLVIVLTMLQVVLGLLLDFKRSIL
jgi:hypothetical protein